MIVQLVASNTALCPAGLSWSEFGTQMLEMSIVMKMLCKQFHGADASAGSEGFKARRFLPGAALGSALIGVVCFTALHCH